MNRTTPGLTQRRGLCLAAYWRVFRRINVADFEARIGRWIRERLGSGDASHIAIDGKTARCSRDCETSGIHLEDASAADVAPVVDQLRVDAKIDQHKAALKCLVCRGDSTDRDLWNARRQGAEDRARDIAGPTDTDYGNIAIRTYRQAQQEGW